MEHALQLVDLVDQYGSVLGVKERRNIQKETDLYHTVFTLLVTPERQIVLSKIPARSDLPNLYAGLLGCTVTTIRRHAETPDRASLRSLENELHVRDATSQKLGDTFQVLRDGRRQYMSMYYTVHPVSDDFSRTDIESLQAFSYDLLNRAVEESPNLFTPSFLVTWERYASIKNLK